MRRKHFLTVSSTIALAVGAVATLAPTALLEAKGVHITPAVIVWMREVGVGLFSIGLIAFAIRGHAPSPTMRAFLFGSAAHQIMLAPIEVLALRAGTITKLSGIAPNTTLHVVLALGFIVCGLREGHSSAEATNHP